MILGPSVQYRDGHLVFDPSKSFNKKAIHQRTLANQRKTYLYDQLLPNELNVLLTRGVHGLYLYAVDDALRAALLEAAKHQG